MEELGQLNDIGGLRLERLPVAKQAGVHVYRISHGTLRRKLNAVSRRRPPYPSELPSMSAQREKLARTGVPTLHVPYMPEATGNLCAEDGWSWFDDRGNFHVQAHNLLLHRRVVQQRSVRPLPKHLPTGRAALAAFRWLSMLHQDLVFGATQLADVLGVSQPRASQLLAALTDQGLVRRVGKRGWLSNPQVCIDAFLDTYRGPGGREQYFFTAFSLLDTAMGIANESPTKGAVSADVGADLLAPMRRPSHVVVYVRQFKAKPLVWSRAKGPHDANVILCEPEDDTLFWDAPPALVERQQLSLAHPTQMLWDLKRLGEGDRKEAFEAMKTWILEHPVTSSPSKRARSSKT